MRNRRIIILLLLRGIEDITELEYLFIHNSSFALLLVMSIYKKQIFRGLRPRIAGYLRRRDLMPMPRVDSPWQALYRSNEDRAFITTMSINCNTFAYILRAGFEDAWNTRTIKRDDVNQHGATRMGRRSLDAAGALGLMLHYLCSTSRFTALQQIFAIVPTVLSRYVHFGLPILLEFLKKIPEGVIKWPSRDEMSEYSNVINARHSTINGAFGFVDGLKLPVANSSDPQVESANYNGWLHSHKINNILVFAPDGKFLFELALYITNMNLGCIIYATINAPGSWHDARVAQDVYGCLLNETPRGYFLIADTAFPKLQIGLQNKIHTPLKARTNLRHLTPGQRLRAIRYSNSITSARQAVEWGMRAIQGAFGRLKMPLDANDTKWRQLVIETCLRMHNVRTRTVEINQIRTVYMPVFTNGRERDFFDVMGSMIFSDIRRSDRLREHYLELGDL
ncbi:DDE superfamily endonuclease [Ceratobasidium sp. AG-Ba]|nr:DDE superfamily endonuclease [Ceratobasidium sp. AG-Ba]QRV84825.1 DDE superfamily endonuclease [Ceratobasidium sp. AG-Ba]QRV90205.1 DDE superfamily endonuclease [Ceratobasidium sp. AG-Ba]QRV90315.1 DDE superfamily endonuclease [Ceratobasidium sp. AG-Ba]QRV96296.1 DDE superfamily endonuclease [Ceratobasidium sp. AG-Ba]